MSARSRILKRKYVVLPILSVLLATAPLFCIHFVSELIRTHDYFYCLLILLSAIAFLCVSGLLDKELAEIRRLNILIGKTRDQHREDLLLQLSKLPDQDKVYPRSLRDEIESRTPVGEEHLNHWISAQLRMG
jgi:hypothetical protein